MYNASQVAAIVAAGGSVLIRGVLFSPNTALPTQDQLDALYAVPLPLGEGGELTAIQTATEATAAALITGDGTAFDALMAVANNTTTLTTQGATAATARTTLHTDMGVVEGKLDTNSALAHTDSAAVLAQVTTTATQSTTTATNTGTVATNTGTTATQVTAAAASLVQVHTDTGTTIPTKLDTLHTDSAAVLAQATTTATNSGYTATNLATLASAVGPVPATLLASAARTTDPTPLTPAVPPAKGAYFILDVTAVPGVDTIALQISGVGPLGTPFVIVQGLVLATTGTRVYYLYPSAASVILAGSGITAVQNLSLPPALQVKVVHSGNGSFTYSLQVQWLG